MRSLRGCWVATWAMAAMLGAMSAPADDKKPLTDKHGAKALVDSLKDVINTGADLFNNHGDYAGCYRLYQGGLLAVKPFLNPDLQAKIDKAIVKAEAMVRFSDKAFELRAVIDEIRDQAKAVLAADGAAPPNPTPKKAVPPVDPKLGQLTGTVTYRGKPAPPGFVTLVGDEQRFSATINDGHFAFRTPLAPGRYKVAIERIPGAQIPENLDIPARFRSELTSGLEVEIVPGKQVVNITLTP